jgi:hypothetical protein
MPYQIAPNPRKILATTPANLRPFPRSADGAAALRSGPCRRTPRFAGFWPKSSAGKSFIIRFSKKSL